MMARRPHTSTPALGAQPPAPAPHGEYSCYPASGTVTHVSKTLLCPARYEPSPSLSWDCQKPAGNASGMHSFPHLVAAPHPCCPHPTLVARILPYRLHPALVARIPPSSPAPYLHRLRPALSHSFRSHPALVACIPPSSPAPRTALVTCIPPSSPASRPRHPHPTFTACNLPLLPTSHPCCSHPTLIACILPCPCYLHPTLVACILPPSAATALCPCRAPLHTRSHSSPPAAYLCSSFPDSTTSFLLCYYIRVSNDE
ncbi:hypothetical protein BD779DRAFT_1797500 [Infundibulicybe gibba]|nr:hypothetical protein BD779DRAFT_1797500 [Infundibulicybe gibba]